MSRHRTSLRKQRGYLYLSTGANGAGKTLFTLEDVRKLQLETNRPVFYKGFTAKQPLKDFGWVEHDMKDWQSLPDGSICIWDECQDEIISGTAKEALEYEKKILSEHRKRGFDFFLITQHPMNMGAFIRRAIETPGWHRHFKASTIALNSNELKWVRVNAQPEKANSGATGTITSRTHPKEIYDWYTSTAGDTATRKIPARVWMAILALIAAVGMIGGAVWWGSRMYSDWSKPKGSTEAAKAAPAPTQAAAASPSPRREEKLPMTAAEFAASYVPRVEGLTFTAPRYDALNEPRTAPRPAACLDGTKRGAKRRTCECWSQQATILQVPQDLCRQIAAGGYFDDTREPHQASNQPAPAPAGAPAAVIEQTSAPSFTAGGVLPPPDTKSTISRDAETLAFMAKRREFK